MKPPSGVRRGTAFRSERLVVILILVVLAVIAVPVADWLGWGLLGAAGLVVGAFALLVGSLVLLSRLADWRDRRS